MALALLVPALVLATAALTNRGPDGAPRVAVFPAAITLYDPLVWDSLRTSVLVAAIVALITRCLGVSLAWIITRWRFWGRRPLAALGRAPVVLPPLFGALGLRLLLGDDDLVPWAPTRLPLKEFWNATIGGVWLVYIWVEAASLTPLVILAASRALARIDPAWEDAGRVVGAGRRALWRSLIWPLIRPDVHRATALVFSLALLDAGAPLALGLRRTLPSQIVEATITPDGGNRAAQLLILGLLLVGLAHWLATRLPRHLELTGQSPPPPPPFASWRRTFAQTFILSSWCVLAWTPTLALLLEPGVTVHPHQAGLSGGLPSLPFLDRAVLGVFGVSLLVGALAAVLGLGLAWLGTARPRGGPSRWALRRFRGLAVATPPLALGVVILLAASVSRLFADLVSRQGHDWARPLALGLRSLGGLIDAYQSPAIGLIAGLVLMRLPLLAIAARSARRRCPPEFIDAALIAGASRRLAWWDIARPLQGPTLARAGLLAAALAASDVSMALVLTPLSTFQMLGPTVLRQFDQPHGLPATVALAMMAAIVNVVAYFLAMRDDPPLDGLSTG